MGSSYNFSSEKAIVSDIKHQFLLRAELRLVNGLNETNIVSTILK